MLGWMLSFGLMFSCGAIAALVSWEPVPGMTLCLVFGFLLVICALTLILRGRA
jgi:hypothetical protein